MTLTGYNDINSDGELIDKAEVETELRSLGESNVEEHDKNVSAKTEEAIQECNHPAKKEKEETPSIEVNPQLGASLLFGLSGLLLGGPILALLTGGGAAYVASNNEGPVGNAARASGEFAIETGSKVGDAAKEANEKHGILDKIRIAFAAGWGKVRQFDEEHHASEKVKETVRPVKEKVVECEKKHHVVENILEGIHNGVIFLLEKLRNTTAGEEGEHENHNSTS